MKKLGLLTLILVFILSSCTTIPKVEDINCDLTPEHVDCQTEEVSCELTPEHVDCQIEEVNCSVTPEHADCKVEDVNCLVTPEHAECQVVEVNCNLLPDHYTCEAEDILTCEDLGESECLFTYAEANADDTFTIIGTYKTLKLARKIINGSNNPNVVVLYNNDVVAMKYGVVNFKNPDPSQIIILGRPGFPITTYINGYYNVDAVFLYTDSIFTYGMISGVKFEVMTNDIQLIPHIQLNDTYSYYENQSGELYHYVSYDLESRGYHLLGPIDIAPNYLEEGHKYYSYDNRYFYTDIITMTDDLTNETYENSINYETPYYNYYQYLSFRSKTNYTAEELNTYLNSIVTQTSVLRDSGEQFINAQDNVFINAAMELSFAIHESGWGGSLIARTKFNLFGINAVDANPYDAALSFDSIEECIVYHTENFLQPRYFDPSYSVSFGTNFGNKNQGMNYKYASDAFWGEKIAGYYYRIDKALGFKDRNHYPIIILNPDAVGYYGPNTTSPIVYNPNEYTYNGLDIPFIIVRETTDFYVLQLPLAINEEFKMDPFKTMTITDVFYVEKDSGTIIN